MGDYADLAAFVALSQVTGLALSPDGSRLVAVVQAPDEDRARYRPALWEIPLAGGEPVRLTRSAAGESAPVFRADGSLLFVSKRDGDEPALWALPPAGEPVRVAEHPGGLTAPQVGGDAVLAGGSRLVGSGPADDDAERRRQRKDRKISAILNTGSPIRYWDHELGAESARLLLVEDDEVRDLTPDAGHSLAEADASISADGATVATTWRRRGPRGELAVDVVLIDTATGKRTTLAGAGEDHDGPRIAPDGSRVALTSSTPGSYEVPTETRLRILGTGAGIPAVTVDTGDLWPAGWVWSPDSATLFVTGDRHGRGAVLAVEAATGATRLLAEDAVYSALRPSPDGSLYALRSTVDSPPAPVRLSTADGTVEFLPTPAPVPPLPGVLEEVDAEVRGATVRGWLCRPEGGDPAPLMLWIHGGPFASFNAWSWRWNPWVAVAHGWAVLLPDPALSTGYGPEWISRAWPHRAEPVWADLEGLLDAVVERPDVDGTRTVCAGASFGGYLTNWVAGHTDRFGAIVTHSGTWALDQKNTTADVAYNWGRWFGTPADHPDWYAENSPHLFADRIRTPMLITHGNRDYRVPVGEALRLWWDLVSRWDGDPEELPHRFLNFPDENHWILSPAAAEIWFSTVLGFCGQHVLGRPWTPSELL